MTILSTTDYSIFNLHGSNRPVRDAYVNILKRSISENNLLKYRPIICDKNMSILDGQHRLEVAKQLKIPIYYKIEDTLGIEEVLMMNTQFAWKNEDFFHYFINQSYAEYLELKKFMNTYGYKLNEAMSVISLSFRNGRHGNTTFKTGKFIFPTNEMPEIQKKIKTMEEIKTYLKKTNPKMRKHVRQPLFCKSLINFLGNKSVNPEIFITKLKYNVDLMHACRTMELYMDLFRKIYNWNNKKKLEN